MSGGNLPFLQIRGGSASHEVFSSSEIPFRRTRASSSSWTFVEHVRWRPRRITHSYELSDINGETWIWQCDASFPHDKCVGLLSSDSR